MKTMNIDPPGTMIIPQYPRQDVLNLHFFQSTEISTTRFKNTRVIVLAKSIK